MQGNTRSVQSAWTTRYNHDPFFKTEVLKYGGQLKDIEYRMYEDITKELHKLRKAPINKLKKVREWMLTSSSGPQLGFTV